jgi:hypothetical protein
MTSAVYPASFFQKVGNNHLGMPFRYKTNSKAVCPIPFIFACLGIRKWLLVEKRHLLHIAFSLRVNALYK